MAVGLGAIEYTPPEAILREGVPSVLSVVPENRQKASIELAHWGYGAAAGMVFALLPAKVRAWRVTGPVYGVLSWGVFEAAIAPVFGLSHAHRSRPNERFALLVDHALFGFVLGTLQETNVAGPERLEDGQGNEEDGGSTSDQVSDQNAGRGTGKPSLY